MKVLNLYGVDDLRYDDVPKPKPQKGEVLLKVRACGICGSDIPRVYEKGTYHFPTVIGHEFAGEVVESEEKELLGRRAAVFPLLPCGKCDACEEGHYAQCKSYSYYGSRQDGGMAEFLAVKKENLCLLPDGVPFEWGAMSEPAAVALHALRQSGASVGDTLFLYGIGTISLLIAQWAKAAGVGRIIMAGRTEAKLSIARKMGFEAVHTENAATVQDMDVCIEGTGCSEGVAACLQAARNFARVVLLGNPPGGGICLKQKDYWHILRKELQLLGTWNSSYSTIHNDWRQAVWGMQTGILQLPPLITHTFLLEDYQQAFSLMHEKKEVYLKVMLTMGDEK